VAVRRYRGAEAGSAACDLQDLLEPGHYHCYACIIDARTGECLPAFSVQREVRVPA
jgi:hypothetical protein